MARIVWTEPAVTDLHDLLQYAANSSPAYAASLAERLTEAAERFAEEPHSGWQVAEFREPTIREVYVSPYRLIYQVRADRCLVVAIVHASRDLHSVVDPRLA